MLVFKNTFWEYLNIWPLRTTIIKWKKYALSLITVLILGLYDSTELSEDERYI